MRIMTVCLGNICRSPAAEAVLVRQVEEAGLDDIDVSSTGTGDYHIGSRPHPESIAEGERRGYTFATRAAQFVPSMFEDVDLIVVMDSSNEADLLALARTPQDEAKVIRLGAFASDAATGVRDVPDPWGLPREAYVSMYDQVEDAVAGLVQALTDGTAGEIVAAHRVLR
ncbi:MAG: low molecular weight protein-tyrosine-phosphatase [Ornithinimicrobium sp.]|uniref:low molecular weight protein-tyrosine-phosphatase n=1 Tax=Ornithinimicrobium sp. TaxID=1977084 RepID=UPI0026E07E90|nr:low molecular weight protein-tyrosine-phosphatase [Ornithinimicrobium sp.]MDO5739594.1 low molecular weight protein-tyrosine-phosphatase [Ornithinimicrobium sp.]